MKTNRKENIKAYLLFRLSVEKTIDNLKEDIKNRINPIKSKISETKNVSVQKINFYITLFKPNFKKDNIQDEIFKTLIESFEYSPQAYIDNEIIIKNYIKVSIETQLELARLRASVRAEIKEYKENNKNIINFNAAEGAFVEIRRTIKEHIIDPNYMQDLDEAREVAKEIILSEMNIEAKTLKPKKHKFTEKEILEILMGNKEIRENIDKL